ncbi:site-specific recombinase [Chitinophagaceae bacterium LWZ2-11]
MGKKEKIDLIQASINGSLELRISDKQEGIAFLIDFFKQVRPKRKKGLRNADVNLQRILELIHTNETLLKNFRVAIIAQLINTDLKPALTENGLLQSRGFVQEFIARINHKILPALQSENDFLYVINQVFYNKKDYVWVEEISQETWKHFFELIGLPFAKKDRRWEKQLLDALFHLSYKVASNSMEPEVAKYMSKAYADDNPFIKQNNLTIAITGSIESDNDWERAVPELHECLETCADCLQQIKEVQATEGASLSLTYSTLVIGYLLDRMMILSDALDGDHYFNMDKLVRLFKELVRNEKRKNSLRELSSQSFGYIAYQIAEHKGKKGDKYITATKEGYNKMIVSAMWGGFIISFVVLFKKLLGKLVLPPFWQGAAFGTNYAIGFIVIEETHSVLATKQPAFTASAVASSLDTKKNEQPNLYNLAITVARVIRSQIASFFGNLVIVFPFTFFFAWAYNQSFGHPLATKQQAVDMLQELHPWQSLSLLYAANTGVFLFLSGLIAGFIQNKCRYGRISERMQMHPGLRLTFSHQRLKKIGDYVEHHAGSWVGNIILGYLLGMSGIIMQKLFGIPFDIRHITIAAGNAGIAMYTLGIQNISTSYFLISFIGVLGIGLLNFLVSFSLAFIVALKSRGIKLRDYPEFFKILWRYFKNNPLNFIVPPAKS